MTKYISIAQDADETDMSSLFARTLWRVASFLLPHANPDFDEFYPYVVLWWVETDDAGMPLREVGFDTKRKPIVLGPHGRNVGVITDSDAEFADDPDEPEVRERFELAWEEAARNYKHIL